MKFSVYCVIYNDFDYCEEAISSLIGFGRLNIIEGAWQSSIKAGWPARSDELTLNKINKFVNGKNVILHQVNTETETTQRQFGLDLAKEEKADYCFMCDADEIFSFQALINIYRQLENNKKDFGFKLWSYNFVNSFNRYYDGLYPRIYRVTPSAKVAYHNNVEWPGEGISAQSYIELPESKNNRFFHYNYVKSNKANFQNKIDRLKNEMNTDLSQHGYSVDEAARYTIPIPENEIYDFTGSHPSIMRGNKNFIDNIYGDKDLKFS